MAHSAQARKRIRQNAKRRLHNRTVRSDLRTHIKRFRSAVATEGADVGAVLSAVESKLDKAAKRNVIPAGRANRLKARLKKLAPVAAAPSKSPADA
jgi:small subunit ribosomal protein S20